MPLELFCVTTKELFGINTIKLCTRLDTNCQLFCGYVSVELLGLHQIAVATFI